MEVLELVVGDRNEDAAWQLVRRFIYRSQACELFEKEQKRNSVVLDMGKITLFRNHQSSWLVHIVPCGPDGAPW